MNDGIKRVSTFRKRRTPEPSEAQIHERAQKLFLERGGHPGREREDWLEAERELRSIFAS